MIAAILRNRNCLQGCKELACVENIILVPKSLALAENLTMFHKGFSHWCKNVFAAIILSILPTINRKFTKKNKDSGMGCNQH